VKPAVAEGGPAPQTQEDEFQQLPRRQVILTMGGVMMALFLASLDQTIVGTALPRIVADLGGFELYAWVATAYMVASTVVVPIVGRLSDMYGRKWFCIAGMVVFLIGSALAGLSQTMVQLIGFRAFQGLGGGAMMAIAFVAIGDLFPPAERGKYQGILAGVFGLSSIIGPALGGFITDTWAWHWIFYVNIPLGIPVIALFIRFFPNVRGARAEHVIDYAGVAALILAVVPVLLGLSWGGAQYEWASPQVIGALSFGAVMTAAFVFIETRAAEPIIPLGLFRNNVVTLSIVAIVLTGFGMFGAMIYIPLYFQAVLGASATSSGTFLTPMMLGTVVGAALSGQALSRLGGHYRWQGAVGIAIMAVGTALFSRVTPETSNGAAVARIVVMGFGLGITFPVFTIAIQNTVPFSLLGVATSSAQFFRSIGGTVGLAVLGAVMVNRFSDGFRSTLPEAARAVVPQEQIAALIGNPQALVNPEATAGLRESFAALGPQGAAAGEQVFETLRSSLSSAIGSVFLVSLTAILVALVATLFIREIPLKKKNASGRESAASDANATVPTSGEGSGG